MNMGFNTERAHAILQTNFGQGANATIALLTELPSTDHPNGVEVSATTNVVNSDTGKTEAKPNGYARIPLETITAKDGYITNTKALHFPEAEESWGTVVGFVIYSSFMGVNTRVTAENGTVSYTFYTDTGAGFCGAFQEAKVVPKETIPLFRKEYIRIGLDHTPPAINV